MVPSSYLRIYQPLTSMASREQARWSAYIENGAQQPLINPYRHVVFADPMNMGLLYPSNSEHAFVKNVSGEWFVCPWRTKLRVLVGMLTARNTLPYEVADAFVPEEAAAKAASELEQLRERENDLLSNIMTATWHVPLRWLTAFEDLERLVTTERGRVRVKYETKASTAMERIQRALEIMRTAGMAESVTDPIVELVEWLQEFPDSSILELDYGTVSELFSDEELVLDHSAAEIWSCMEALRSGDFEESGRIYSDLATWWGRVRALESTN